MDPEDAVWVGHPSHWNYLGQWVLGLILAPVLVGFFIIWWIFVDRGRRTYTITPTRVIFEHGLFAKNSQEVRIQDIRSIAVQKRGLRGLFSVGDVEFSSAATDDAEVVFAAVPEVEKVRDLVRGYQKP